MTKKELSDRFIEAQNRISGFLDDTTFAAIKDDLDALYTIFEEALLHYCAEGELIEKNEKFNANTKTARQAIAKAFTAVNRISTADTESEHSKKRVIDLLSTAHSFVVSAQCDTRMPYYELGDEVLYTTATRGDIRCKVVDSRYDGEEQEFLYALISESGETFGNVTSYFLEDVNDESNDESNDASNNTSNNTSNDESSKTAENFRIDVADAINNISSTVNALVSENDKLRERIDALENEAAKVKGENNGIDWEQRRYEVVKDCLQRVINGF